MLKKNYTNLSKEDFYIQFFNILNSMQTEKEDRLTDREIDVAVEFLLLEPKHELARFGKESRKEIAKRITDKKGKNFSVKNLNIALNTLKHKGVIFEDKDKQKYFHKFIKENVKDKEEIEFYFYLENGNNDGKRSSESRELREEYTTSTG